MNVSRTIVRAARIAAAGAVLALGVLGCHKTAATNNGDQNAGDPADANFAPVDGSATGGSAAQPARVLAQSSSNEAQQQAEDYSQQPAAPIERQAPSGSAQQYAQPDNSGQYADQSQDAAADAYAADLTSEAATEPPPPLPDYEQPPAPEPDDLWTPGYWAWGPAGYYWVPGAWVVAPYAGALWTPGYWGFVGASYRWHHGFWGPHIGFYGGIDYGFGYTGFGYYGGYWRGSHFFYNTAVNRVNVNVIRNVYVHNVVVNNVVVNNRIINRTSFNGGRGGIDVRPRPAELAVMHEQRIPPMQSQLAVRQEAAGNRAQFFNQNHGRPQMATVAAPVHADRTLPAALPRVNTPAGNQFHPGASPAARGVPENAGRPEAQRPNQPQSQGARPAPGQPTPQQNEHSQFRPNSSHPENTPAPQPQARPEYQSRPGNAPQPAQPRPNMEARPAPQPEQRPQPQQRPEQARPAPQPQQHVEQPRPQPQQHVEQPRPQPQQHVQQAPHPAPQHQAPAPHEAPHEEHPHH